MPSIEELPMKGIYTLIIFLSKDACLSVGKLGIHRFPRGYYTYTGSALGIGALSLSRRISRHLRKEKRKHWHIDFLLAHENATITAVVAARTNRKVECKINRYIKEETGAEIPLIGFGAFDCVEGCESHLLYFDEENVKSKIAMLYAEKLGSGSVIIDFV